VSSGLKGRQANHYPMEPFLLLESNQGPSHYQCAAPTNCAKQD
jgi:hypothetical protein